MRKGNKAKSLFERGAEGERTKPENPQRTDHRQNGALATREFEKGLHKMGENEIGKSIEDILTIQSGGRLGIPSRTLKELELKEGDLVFVEITKAKVSKVGFEKEGQKAEEL